MWHPILPRLLQLLVDVRFVVVFSSLIKPKVSQRDHHNLTRLLKIKKKNIHFSKIHVTSLNSKVAA